MKCLNKDCDACDIEKDDNFCYKCGYITARGYSFITDEENIKIIQNNKSNKLSNMLILLMILFLLFTILGIIRGNDLFRPIYFVKRKVDSFLYGYNTAIIKTDNLYNHKEINNLDDAYKIIKDDFNNQNYKCSYALDNLKIEKELEEEFSIPSVSFCDIPYEESEKLKEVIEKMYNLFPEMTGALTNISITNAKTKSEFIAYFQPSFQFVNSNNDINSYNKVNKTQILLNSYYFLNKNIISKPLEDVVGDNWYAKDATFESTLSHELGHYLLFVIFLRENGLGNITYVTKENESKINNLLNEYDKGNYSLEILNQALNNYNNKYNENIDLDTFSLNISKYANVKNNGKLLSNETIAEAIHDYYLHGTYASKSSYEIVEILKRKLKV